MSKVPVTSSDSLCASEGKQNKSIVARIDLMPTMSIPDGATLGSKIELKLTGTIVALKGCDMSEYKDSKGKKVQNVYPGELKLEIKTLKIDGVGDFDGMDE